MTSILDPVSVRAVLLDIEGTTTPISFVHEVLFPFARARVRDYLSANTTETEAEIAALEREHAADVASHLDPPMLVDGSNKPESIVAYVQWLIDCDRKSTTLKSIQGKIWSAGYADGSLKAPLFPDVAPAFARWHAANLKISIFSSGSTLAQKLLFAHTETGDLTHLIDQYFDTTTGPKTEIKSYQNIASALSRSEREILFISDVVAELDAANAAGMQTLLCVRPGNSLQPAEDHLPIRSFGEIPLPVAV
jgi:enolase-phosphatase E1